MYELIFGILVGAVCTKLASRNITTVDQGVQAWEVPDLARTAPISIRNSFTPGTLKNFWGPDS